MKQLEDNIEHSAKFNFVKSAAKFLIHDVPADPEQLLSAIFQHCIDKTLSQAREKGCDADQLGCTISSELLESDIWTPIRQFNENTTDAILNRFLQVAQSKKQREITLWTQPFSVNITAINRKKLPPKQKQVTGGQRKRTIAAMHHRISDNCLIKANSHI